MSHKKGNYGWIAALILHTTHTDQSHSVGMGGSRRFVGWLGGGGGLCGGLRGLIFRGIGGSLFFGSRGLILGGLNKSSAFSAGG